MYAMELGEKPGVDLSAAPFGYNTYYEPEPSIEDNDNGTMPANVQALEDVVIGHKIVRVVKDCPIPDAGYGRSTATVIELDDGTQVGLEDTDDCCAFTSLEAFLLHPEMVDHAILGVGTTDNFHTWHIYCDYGDILELTVGWSCGNPFYYGYGFDIKVFPLK